MSGKFNAIIIPNVPQGTELGIDYNPWYVGPNFRGVKDIPSGLHFIFTSMVDQQERHAPRNGQFLYFPDDPRTKGVVLRSKWDEQNEELYSPFTECKIEDIDNEAALLAPYPDNKVLRTWQNLTCYIKGDTVSRLSPLCGRLSVSTQVDCTEMLEKRERQKLGIPDKEDEHFQNVKIRFTVIPEKKFPDGASPSDITKYSMDNSFVLESLLSSLSCSNAEDEILGEIQFAFVCFMIGQVFDAFEHWKAMMQLICKCDESLSTRPMFFVKFFDVIMLQIKEIPEDFFVDIVAERNFLVQTLKIMFGTIKDSTNLNRRLLEKAEMLKDLLIKTFDWNLELEDDEDMPVIVD
eukprot:gene3096-1386_t